MAPVSKPRSTSPPYLTALPSNVVLSADQIDALRQVEWAFDISTSRLTAIVQRFQEEFQLGLSKEHTPETKDLWLPMIPTFCHDVPNGKEKGVYLALDLGGTNLRVCEVTLNGDHTFAIRSQKYRVSEQLKTGPVAELMDYIAGSVDDFLSELGTSIDSEEELHLGFTFSFPVHQTALNCGTLISWTKGFKATGAIGNDVVKMLQDALDRKHTHVRCNSLVNDTVGTLMAHAYQSGDALAGAIFGTGTNGAYLERMSSITKMQPPPAYSKMIVNTEWGAFDNERKVLPITLFDNKLDRQSINPRKQAFEKMISGMYLGEVTRNILLFLIDSYVLFDGHSSPIINTHYGLDTSLLSAIEALSPAPGASLSAHAEAARMAVTREVLEKDLSMPKALITDKDCVIVQRVCELVGTRAARLSATAVAVVAKQTGHNEATSSAIHVGVDGSVAEHYPHFEARLRAALCEVSGESVEKRVVIGLAKDGSGVGAALVAALATRKAKSTVKAAPPPKTHC